MNCEPNNTTVCNRSTKQLDEVVGAHEIKQEDNEHSHQGATTNTSEHLKNPADQMVAIAPRAAVVEVSDHHQEPSGGTDKFKSEAAATPEEETNLTAASEEDRNNSEEMNDKMKKEKQLDNNNDVDEDEAHVRKVVEQDVTATNTITENGGGQYSSEQSIDAECEKLLRNTKKQVKQMMEEGVTKKFIHSESSSIMSLCVAVDACLSHGLKRRALGLFKTNSSIALIQKVAKSNKSAQELLELVNNEEKRLLEEQQQQVRKLSISQQQQYIDTNLNTNSNSNNNNKIPQQVSNFPLKFSPAKVASNISTHRRNLWIKCALIEKKLVEIVEHLAENSTKYYEPEALMSNYLCSQILASLLVGPTALEFSRSKLHDSYQFDEPSADELLKRHKLASPIACLCNSSSSSSSNNYSHYLQYTTTPVLRNSTNSSTNNDNKNNKNHTSNNIGMSLSNGKSLETSQLNDTRSQPDLKQLENTPPPPPSSSATSNNPAQASTACCTNPNNVKQTTSNSNSNNTQRNLRRPLSLKTSNIIRGTLVTDCHHYSCQEMSEHQHPRGYSIFGSPSDDIPSTSGGIMSNLTLANATSKNNGTFNSIHTNQDWSTWSPRMLHETLHQNSRSNLLYGKNNVLLETQPNETIAGYLSLHQFSSELILKWIPNRMINGSQFVCCQCSSNRSSKKPVKHREEEKAEEERNNTRLETDEDKLDNEQMKHNSKCCCGDNNELHQKNSNQVAVEKSCLELVVSLSVSRIVLLHCQFNISQHQKLRKYNDQQQQHSNQPMSEQSTGGTGKNSIDKSDLNGTETNEDKETQVEILDSTLSLSRTPNTEETLILIEADGVQRSPFKFPKGGLRLFLSCLESGLEPFRYLDPAINFDSDCDWIDLLLDPVSNQTKQQLDSPTPSESSTNSGSKFDSLLKRLPSLKRPAVKNNEQQSTAETNEARTQSPDSTQNNDENKKLENNDKQSNSQQQVVHQLTTVNYVYRIVPVQQPSDHAQQTPPLSALSFGSSSSGSMVVSAANAQQQQQLNTSQERFKWSLSRLARFSSKYKNSSSNNSTTSSNSTSTRIGADGTRSLSGMQTNEHTSSITSDTTSLDPTTVCFDTDQQRSQDSNSRELARIEAKLHDLKESASDSDVLLALRTHSIQTLCDSMRKQIVARAFYGWLVYCRKAKIIRSHLLKLIKDDDECFHRDEPPANIESIDESHRDCLQQSCLGLTMKRWKIIMSNVEDANEDELHYKVNQLVYFGGIENDELRREVWPYLLGHYKFKYTESQRKSKDQIVRDSYELCVRNWNPIEKIVTQRDKEILAANIAKAKRVAKDNTTRTTTDQESGGSYTEIDSASNKSLTFNTDINDGVVHSNIVEMDEPEQAGLDSLEELPVEEQQEYTSDMDSLCDVKDKSRNLIDKETIDSTDNLKDENQINPKRNLKEKGSSFQAAGAARQRRKRRPRLESTGSVGSDASITDQFGNNIHRIDKDVQRCDRNFWYFKETKNLEKLRNIMCSYVWQHLDVGYVQGMCDLAAPFLVIFDDEVLAYSCFSHLMERMVSNFPHGSAMDQHFESLKYLMQVLDPRLFEVLQNNGDYTHFYFCYRWLLLDFKRELAYEDVYRVWETIWSARQVVTDHFVIFMALAMVRYYRDIIIENNMDFTDTIKFFNEMAERHDAKRILALARDCLVELQNLRQDIHA